MSWLETLQGTPAMVGGVKAVFGSISSTVARRVAVHRLVGAGVRVQDLGDDVYEHTLELEAIGADYMVKRNALEAVLRRGGPLVIKTGHRGELTVQVTSPITSREAFRDGSIAVLTFTCIELDDRQPQLIKPAVDGLVASSAAAVITASEVSFAGTWNGSLPGALLDSATTEIGRASAFIGKANRAIASQISGVGNLSYEVGNLSNQAATLVSQPSALAAQMVAAVGTAFESVRNLEGAVYGVKDALLAAGSALLAFILPADSGAVTTARQAEESNRRALEQLVRVVGFGELCRTVVVVPFNSVDDAVVVKDQIVEWSDLVSTSTDSELYTELQNLRRLTGEHLAQVAKTLPEVRSYEPLANLPAFVVAHDLYGDATRAAELVARNAVSHPGFVGYGPLEVLRV